MIDTFRDRRRLEPLLARMLALALLSTIMVSSLVYPLRVPDSVLRQFESLPEKGSFTGWLYHQQFRSFIAFTHSPLVIKECLAQTYLLFSLVVLALLLGVRSGGKPTVRSDWKEIAKRPFPWLIGLLALTGAGAIAWSPTLNYSLRTYLSFATGIVMFMAIAALPASRHFARKFMALVCLCGAVVAFVALLMHIQAADWFLPIFKNEPRNRIGSLIGHNTGLSSWLLFPLSFCIYGMIVPARGWVRLCSAVLGALILFVIVAAQSRAIWILGFLMTVGSALFMLRQVGRRPGLKSWLVVGIVILLAIGLQTFAPRYNPLARHVVSLGQRVRTDLVNPGQLLRETRLRILFASGLLVKEDPVLGHGIGSFQYVYPPAQGKFLADKPDTKLGLTSKRTDVAHNDWLQYLVECGLLGVVLLAFPLAYTIRRGTQAWRATGTGRDRALLAAIAFPAAAVAVHALFDFPMHIVPIALLEVFAAGLWYSGKEIVDLPAEEAVDATNPTVPLPESGNMAALVVIGVTMTLIVFASSVMIARDYVSDIYFSDGQNWLSSYRVLPPSRVREQANALQSSIQQYNRATRIQPFHGQARESLAFAFSGMGRLDFTQFQATQGKDNKKAEIYLANARSNYQSAIRTLVNLLNLKEYRWHYTYYLIGQAYKMLWRINLVEGKNRPETPFYLQSAIKALSTATEINIADAVSHFELAELYEKQPTPDLAKAAYHKRLIFIVDLDFAKENLVQPIMESAKHASFNHAFKQFEDLKRAVGHHWYMTYLEADLHLRRAKWPPIEIDRQMSHEAAVNYAKPHLDKGEAVLRSLSKEDLSRLDVRRLLLRYAAARFDYKKALALADELGREYPLDVDIASMRVDLAKLLGQKRDPAPVVIGPEYTLALNHNRLFYLGQEVLGCSQLTKAAEAGQPIGIDDGLRATQVWLGVGQPGWAIRMAKATKNLYPADPYVDTLLNQANATLKIASTQ